MFQSPALDTRLRVRENLRHHGHLYGMFGRRLTERIREMLSLVRMGDRAADLVDTLSGGLRRRVELAKALLPAPSLLLLDEPSTGARSGARREIWDYLERLRRDRGTTVVVTTHLMEEAAECDRVGILHEGRLVALGSPDALTAEIGGDVILVTTRALDALADKVRTRFGERVEIVDGHLRLERQRAHEFVPALVEAFPGEIDAVTSANRHSKMSSCITPAEIDWMILATCTLWARDIVRFYRQRSRIVGRWVHRSCFARARLGAGIIVSQRFGRTGELPRVLLSGHARAHRPVHGDLFDDFGHRRPPGRFSAGCAGRARVPERDRDR